MSGDLIEAVAFDLLQETPDGRGGYETTWAEQFTDRAEFRYERGKEAVEAGGLTGSATWKVKLRSHDATRALTTDHQMRDVRRQMSFQVREVDAISDRMYVWLVVETGKAVTG